MKSLETALNAVRSTQRRAFVPYVVAGAKPDWCEGVEALIAGGADAVEIGVPFSDPMIDGPVIQEASTRSLARGTTFTSLCRDLTRLGARVPLIAMTYYNVVHHDGLERAAGRLRDAGVSGVIIPDLPLEEDGPWRLACDAYDVACVLLAAPSTPPRRLQEIAERTEGFLYVVARMAVTGISSGVGDAARVVEAVRAVSDAVAYVGIGIATTGQAREAATFSDGVIVGSALVRLTLEGASPEELEQVARTYRAALDESTAPPQ